MKNPELDMGITQDHSAIEKKRFRIHRQNCTADQYMNRQKITVITKFQQGQNGTATCVVDGGFLQNPPPGSQSFHLEPWAGANSKVQVSSTQAELSGSHRSPIVTPAPLTLAYSDRWNSNNRWNQGPNKIGTRYI